MSNKGVHDIPPTGGHRDFLCVTLCQVDLSRTHNKASRDKTTPNGMPDFFIFAVMKPARQKINLDNWERKAHFSFFKTYEEPFFGVCVMVDCTRAYQQAKSAGHSFFLSYLHKSITAVNQTESFRHRIEGEEVYLYDRIDVGTTVDRDDGTFGFSYIPYHADFDAFSAAAKQEFERVRNRRDLMPGSEIHHIVHFSSLPWVRFTSLSHARHFPKRESIPKISFGKVQIENGRHTMPYSVHAHHALIDGRQVGEHIDRFQELLNQQ